MDWYENFISLLDYKEICTLACKKENGFYGKEIKFKSGGGVEKISVD